MTNQDRTGADAGQFTRILVRASRTTTARLEQTLLPEGFSLDRWLVVDALALEPGLPMAALAERTAVTGPTLTRVVDRLVSTALVYREVDVHDRRKVRVYLSRRGHARHQRVMEQLAAVERDLLDRAGGPSVLRLLGRLADQG